MSSIELESISEILESKGADSFSLEDMSSDPTGIYVFSYRYSLISEYPYVKWSMMRDEDFSEIESSREFSISL